MGNFLPKNLDMDGYGSGRTGWSGVGLRILPRERLYIVDSCVNCHLNQNNIVHQNQFGFQKKKATYMPILLQDTITRAFEEGEFALGLFLDLKKAFDTVNINILLEKLKKYGIRHKAHKMFSS